MKPDSPFKEAGKILIFLLIADFKSISFFGKKELAVLP